VPRSKTSSRSAELGDLLTQLKIANRLALIQLRKDTTQQELIRILSTTGATPAEIAELLNTTTPTVVTALSRLKRKARPSSTADSTTAIEESEQEAAGG
jgi:DNA-binding CsgD family transcriptional regulator